MEDDDANEAVDCNASGKPYLLAPFSLELVTIDAWLDDFLLPDNPQFYFPS